MSARTFVAQLWTRRLQVTVAVCSVVFTIGTTLQNFVIVTLPMLEHTMRLAGLTESQAVVAAPGFLGGFRLVGTVFIIGNALGILAWWLRRAWLFWLVLAVNLGQAAGVVAIPPEVFRASLDLYGPAGLLPTIITDGGALVLAVIMIASLVRHLRHRSSPQPATP